MVVKKIFFPTVFIFLGLFTWTQDVFAFSIKDQTTINDIINEQKNINTKIIGIDAKIGSNTKTNSEILSSLVDINKELNSLSDGINAARIDKESFEDQARSKIEAIQIKNEAVDSKSIYYDKWFPFVQWFLLAFGVIILATAIVLGIYKKGEIDSARKEFKEEGDRCFDESRKKA